MTDTIDAYWSFRSPYSYLATPDLLRLREEYDVEVNLRVVLPIAVRSKKALFDPSNMKPVKYIIMDSLRRAEFLGLPMGMPRPDPIVQDMETFQLAEEQPHIFENWDRGDHLAEAAAKAGLDLAQMEAAIAGSDHMDEIDANHAALDAAGHWGVPTMVLRGEPFFGQDRIDTLRWRLDKYGLRKA